MKANSFFCRLTCMNELFTTKIAMSANKINLINFDFTRTLITVSVTRLCSPFRLELMVKLRTLLTVFIIVLKAEARDYGKGSYISDGGLWCSANQIAPILQC